MPASYVPYGAFVSYDSGCAQRHAGPPSQPSLERPELMLSNIDRICSIREAEKESNLFSWRVCA